MNFTLQSTINALHALLPQRYQALKIWNDFILLYTYNHWHIGIHIHKS